MSVAKILMRVCHGTVTCGVDPVTEGLLSRPEFAQGDKGNQVGAVVQFGLKEDLKQNCALHRHLRCPGSLYWNDPAGLGQVDFLEGPRRVTLLSL